MAKKSKRAKNAKNFELNQFDNSDYKRSELG